jgi:membrane associated rhomboid family serine protease
MFPYRDENETIRTPRVSYAIIAANALAWLLVQGAGSALPLAESVCNLGLLPGELTGLARVGAALPIGQGQACVVDPGRQVEHVLTSMFLHGSWMHLLGNMWFFWIFGNNVEDSLGHARFLMFYLACGVAAALAQVAVDPDSIVPMVGASGAIGGVMGAYIVLYPHVRVYNLVVFGFYATTVALPAWVMLGYWMLLQVLGGATSMASQAGGGVAYAAHVGGFAAGALLVKLFARPDYVAAHQAHHWRPRRIGFDRGQWR